MNKVEKELQGATEAEQKKGESRTDYLVRLMKAIAGLSEKEWDKLSAEAQAWYNANADKRNAAKKAGKDIPDPADFEEEEPARGRRSSDDDGDEKGKGAAKAAKGETTAVEKLEEGQRVKIITTRDKEVAGTVVENSKRKEYVVVKDADGKETELDYAKVESVEVFHGDAGKEDEGGGAAEPGVGDEVEITTKRGKTIKCTITGMTDDEIEFEDKDGKDDIARDRVESIKVTKKAKGAGKPAAKEEEPAGRRSSKDDKDEEKGKPAEEEGKRTRTTNEGGVSVGLRIKELVAENLDADEAEIVKMLTKEKLAFKENTVHLNFVECHKFIDILKARKLLKTGK